VVLLVDWLYFHMNLHSMLAWLPCLFAVVADQRKWNLAFVFRRRTPTPEPRA